MITITQLEYIVAIDEHRHFATAADKCFVTQPTLSMQVKKLEDELGVILFDRTHHPVIPTDVGMKVVEQAREVLKATKRISDLIIEDSQEVAGNIRIGIIPTLAPYLLPMFIGNYIREYPMVNIELVELESEEIINRLKKDTLDVAIFVTPYHDEHIKEVPIFFEEMLIYASPNHAMLKKEHLEIADLPTSEIWMLSNGHCFRDQVINLCALKGNSHPSLPFQFESNSLETLMKIVDREGGFTFIPELVLQYLPKEKQAQICRLSNYCPLREVSIISSRNYTKARLIDILQQEIKKSIPLYLRDKSRGHIVEWKEN